MILITGAAGKTGRAAIRALVARGQSVRALAHREEQVAPLRVLGVGDCVTGDMRSRTVLVRAARGAAAIYHICPNVHPEETEIGRAAIDGARAAGVRRFVYHSVLHPQTEAMPHHWKKLRVEEALFEAGLAYTILQPASYMQNVLVGWARIVAEGRYVVPYAITTRLSPVDLRDVAEAAAAVLTEPGHEGASYELSGPEALAQDDIAAILSRCLGRTVSAEQTTIDAWAEHARAGGLGPYQIDTLARMFRYYEQHGFCGNPRALMGLLGRPPATFEKFVTRAVREGIDDGA